MECINNAITYLIQCAFYSAYQILPKELQEERDTSLRTAYKAQFIQGRIPYVYIPSQSQNRTGNVVVICLNRDYRDHHPKHWEPFIENGADVVLWNPTELLPVQYEKDLITVLQDLHDKNPNQKIALKAYCASGDPAISAAAQVNFPIYTILDRTYGDTYSLLRSFTILSALCCVYTIIKEYFSCHGMNKINTLKGHCLILISLDDEMMSWGEQHFSIDLAKRANHLSQKIFIPENHWTNWGTSTYKAVLQFLQNHQITASTNIDPSKYKASKPSGDWKISCPNFFIKAWW